MSAVAARPGESLVGLLSRVGKHNHLPHLRALLGVCTAKWHAHFNLAFRDDVDFAQLAHAARLAPHDIEDRRYRTVALTANLPGVTFHGAIIPAYDVLLRPRRLATSWLVGEPFHCALGHHALATHCPISGSLLIDHCPRCDVRLNWSGLDLLHCSACGFDLKTGGMQRVAERELRATRLMLNLIHPDPTQNRTATNLLPELLSRYDRGTVFELGWRFGELLAGGGNGPRIAARHLPVATRMRILEIGSTVLASWPESIRSAVQGLAPGQTVVDPKLPRAVRSLAKARNAWPTIRDAIFAAVPGLAVSAKTGVRSVVPKPANGAELTRSLGVTQRLFERMRAADIFTPISASGVVNQHQIFNAADLAHLREVFADRIPLSSVSERLGISVHGSEQLCCLGEVKLLHDDAALAALKHRHITKSSLDALRDRLEKNGNNPDEAAEWELWPIRRALRHFGGREKPWGPIMIAMLTGELPYAIGPDTGGRLMDRVSIPVCQLHIPESKRFDRSGYPAFGFDRRINRRDTEEMLNVPPTTFDRAMKNAETPATNGGTYDREEVLELASNVLSASEALARWGYGGRTLPKALKGRNAPCRIGNLGWNRAEAEEAMAARNLSAERGLQFAHCRSRSGRFARRTKLCHDQSYHQPVLQADSAAQVEVARPIGKFV